MLSNDVLIKISFFRAGLISKKVWIWSLGRSLPMPVLKIVYKPDVEIINKNEIK